MSFVLNIPRQMFLQMICKMMNICGFPVLPTSVLRGKTSQMIINNDANLSSYHHSHTLGVKKKRQTQSSSWVYETSVSKSIFEDTVIPAGEKRGGRRS